MNGHNQHCSKARWTLSKIPAVPCSWVFWLNFQFVNLEKLPWKVWGVSYNRLCLLTEKKGILVVQYTRSITYWTLQKWPRLSLMDSSTFLQTFDLDQLAESPSTPLEKNTLKSLTMISLRVKGWKLLKKLPYLPFKAEKFIRHFYDRFGKYSFAISLAYHYQRWQVYFPQDVQNDF